MLRDGGHAASQRPCERVPAAATLGLPGQPAQVAEHTELKVAEVHVACRRREAGNKCVEESCVANSCVAGTMRSGAGEDAGFRSEGVSFGVCICKAGRRRVNWANEGGA